MQVHRARLKETTIFLVPLNKRASHCPFVGCDRCASTPQIRGAGIGAASVAIGGVVVTTVTTAVGGTAGASASATGGVVGHSFHGSLWCNVASSAS